ncbi:UNVERIFIED_CONTAM: putative membrane protein [Acetivibrio alkalicellulosi]
MRFSKAIIACFIIILIFSFYHVTYADNYFKSARGKVIQILNYDQNTRQTDEKKNLYESYLVEVKILDGQYSGEVVNAEYTINTGYIEKKEAILFNPGDEVLIYLEDTYDGKIVNAYISGPVRDKYLLYLVGVFVFFLLVIGRFKGLKAIITLGITCLLVIKVFIPLIIKGYDPIVLSVGICALITVISLLIIGGFNKKTGAAIIGTIGGVIIAGIITQLIGRLANLTGLGNEEAQMLMSIPQSTNMDFRGLLFSGIIIGALGAVMDVGMSISSAMNEIEETSPTIRRTTLIGAGMNIGRDVMATMSNTLILAYAGSSLHMILLLVMHDISFVEIINSDMIACEVVRSLAGSIGLIFTIPITAITAGILSCQKKKKKKIGRY